jgi:hypothetical protein
MGRNAEREHLQRKVEALWLVKCAVPQATAYRRNTGAIRPQLAGINTAAVDAAASNTEPLLCITECYAEMGESGAM